MTAPSLISIVVCLRHADDDISAAWVHRQRARKNADAKAALIRKHEQQFATWAFELQEGFNLLMFGFGSKRASCICPPCIFTWSYN